ncbi:hypothetical protein DENIT_40060 [Pseudomonas veronii]|nr:hypothetical protein DENIT_40060 [Pseudomonas veronii]
MAAIPPPVKKPSTQARRASQRATPHPTQRPAIKTRTLVRATASRLSIQGPEYKTNRQ